MRRLPAKIFEKSRHSACTMSPKLKNSGGGGGGGAGAAGADTERESKEKILSCRAYLRTGIHQILSQCLCLCHSYPLSSLV